MSDEEEYLGEYEIELLTPRQLLLRCSICMVHWNQDIKRNTIAKTGLCMGVDPVTIEAFAEFSGRLWDLIGTKGKLHMSAKISANNWGINETYEFLESEVALFELENR